MKVPKYLPKPIREELVNESTCRRFIVTKLESPSGHNFERYYVTDLITGKFCACNGKEQALGCVAVLEKDKDKVPVLLSQTIHRAHAKMYAEMDVDLRYMLKSPSKYMRDAALKQAGLL